VAICVEVAAQVSAMISPQRHRPTFPRACAVASLLVLWLGAFHAKAVVDANSQTNTSPPVDGSPWANVGRLNAGGGIYLANGWVLTAYHINTGSINLGGTVFTYDGLSQRLTNSDSTAADLILFHVKPPPSLPTLPLAASTPTVSATVDMIGFGHWAGSAQTDLGGSTGFYWSPAGAKSWGNNRVAAVGLQVNTGAGIITAFSTAFTAPPAQTSDEAQAAPGDSGGGVFRRVGSNWQLAGVMNAISALLPGQPANSSAYGQSTYCADVSAYRSQMLAIMSATPPVLTIRRSGTNYLLCWPNLGVNYVLQSATNLPPSGWTTVTQAQAPTNADLCVTVPATPRAAFFRLKKSP
jgi:hypothetical protein